MDAGRAGTLALVVTDETPNAPPDDADRSLCEMALRWRSEARSLFVPRCSWCGDVLPAFARLGPLRGGP